EGNFIGTNRAGTAAKGNHVGISVGNAPGTVIGGTTAGAGNVISGNSQQGVYITIGSGTTGLGNYIGTDATGTAALANGAEGVLLSTGANNNTIGGTSAAARNVISGNTGDGVKITGGTSSNNVIEANYIGTTASGLAALPNGGQGVNIGGTFTTV